MHDFLKTIYRSTEQRVQGLNLNTLREQAAHARQPQNFLNIFKLHQFPIIAEIKFASPSAGVILKGATAVEIAQQYLANGAAALSILTEPEYFKGDITYLQQVRKQFPDAYLLMKDFVLSETQLLQGRIAGADAILLIVAFLSETDLELLYHKALELSLTPLIEVHSEAELTTALKLKPQLIGINNRDLRSLKINMSHSDTLISQIPQDVIAISESGITQSEQLVHLKQLGFQGFLIGSHFMKTGTPGVALRNLLNNN
ncbi:MAG TPA: indole-3-glycerol phosphate synthase TrpC [Gammaproteobacteria bacterium]|nr:indole-3-glycerol phosphate synthase TrpC [Gammaproteobacteria bacterium]